MYRVTVEYRKEPAFELDDDDVQITDDLPTLEKTLESLEAAASYVRDFIEGCISSRESYSAKC